ncbi:hypothetical protein D3C72_1282300 [compost metagenome]
MNPEAAQITLDLSQLFIEAIFTQKCCTFPWRAGEKGIPLLCNELFGEAFNIFTMVAIFRHLGRLSKLLQIAGFNGLRQIIDLVPGIVNIIFAGYVITGIVKQVAQRIANCRAACMSQMQAACRIRTYEFDLDLLTLAKINSAIIISLRIDLLDDRIQVALGQGEINEPRACDFGLFNRGAAVVEILKNGFGNLTRVLLRNLSQLHRRIGGEITMCLLLRHFELNGRNFFLGCEARSQDGRRDRFLYLLVNFL